MLLGLDLRLVASVGVDDEAACLHGLTHEVGALEAVFVLDSLRQGLELLVELISLGAKAVLTRGVVQLCKQGQDEERDEEADRDGGKGEVPHDDTSPETDDQGDDGLLEGRTGLPDLLHALFPSRIGQVLTRWYGAKRIHLY